MTTGELDRTPARGSAEHGAVIVKGNIVGTVLFVITAVFAAAVFTTAAQWVGAVTAMTIANMVRIDRILCETSCSSALRTLEITSIVP